MINKLHYIKEDYSGDLEKYCLSTLKRDYPDFEFNAWKPGSSPLRILYDCGGLYVGPGIFSLRRIPETYFQKSFFVFDNVFDSRGVGLNICYSDVEKNPLLLKTMEKGMSYVNDKVEWKPYLNESDFESEDFSIYGKNRFGAFDRLSRFVNKGKDIYLVDSNMRVNEKLEGWNLHYMIVDEKTDSNRLYTIFERFSKLEYKDGSKHFLLIMFKLDGNEDLMNRMSEFLNYHLTDKEKKRWDLIIGEENLLPEYIGRRFDRLLSCEKI